LGKKKSEDGPLLTLRREDGGRSKSGPRPYDKGGGGERFARIGEATRVA